jgi:hypothetical protein
LKIWRRGKSGEEGKMAGEKQRRKEINNDKNEK